MHKINLRKALMQHSLKSQNVVDVKGRHILDSSLIANDCFASRLKTGKPWLFCKLDVEKTYAYIN